MIFDDKFMTSCCLFLQKLGKVYLVNENDVAENNIFLMSIADFQIVQCW